MDWRNLAGPLFDAGLKILATAIGGPAGGIVATVGGAIARELGVGTPDEVVEKIGSDPAAVDKLRELEAARQDEWLALARAGQEMASQLASFESKEGGYAYYWRPTLSWVIVAIVGQTFLVAPWLRAIIGADVSVPYDQVLGIATIWLAIYGGGHTLKSIFAKKAGAGDAAA